MFNRRCLIGNGIIPLSSWADVQQNIQNGRGPGLYPLGGLFPFIPHTDTTNWPKGVMWQVVSHDTQWDSAGTCSHTMTLQTYSISKNSFEIGSSSGVIGTYSKFYYSNFYTRNSYLLTTFLNGFQSDFLNVVKTCKVFCFNVTRGSQATATGNKTTTSDKFWLPSFKEMGYETSTCSWAVAASSWPCVQDGSTPFQYYQNISDGLRIRLHETTTDQYSLRTSYGQDRPSSDNSLGTMVVKAADGKLTGQNENMDYARVAPCCIIG